MNSEPSRWLPACLIRRWGALLWIGPLLGLLTGLMLVFGFLRANESELRSIDTGHLPTSVDWPSYVRSLQAELGSENTLIEIRNQLAPDQGVWKPPLWWLRPRIEVVGSSVSEGLHGEIDVIFTHHSEVRRERLVEAFLEVAKEAAPNERAKYTAGWIEKIDGRLREIDKIILAAQSANEIVFRKDIPFIDERDQLENDREGIVLEDDYHFAGKEALSLPGSFGGSVRTAWWDVFPKWVLLIGKCAGCGLLAVFPGVLLFEGLWPRPSTPDRTLPA